MIACCVNGILVVQWVNYAIVGGMALKTTGKRRVPSDSVEDLAEEGDEDARALVAEEKRDKALGKVKIPQSVAFAMLNKHFERIVKEYMLMTPEDERGGVGRPTTYRVEYCALVVEALGTVPLLISERGLAARLGIPWGTWQGWKERNHEFASSIDLGMQLQNDNMTNVGVYDRVNVAGLIMAMKNSAHRWKDKIEHDIGDNIADLIRKAEENKQTVKWTDIGGYQSKSNGQGVIDAEISEPITNEGGNGAPREGTAEEAHNAEGQ